MIDMRRLKALAAEKLPPDSSFRAALSMELDEVTAEQFEAKFSIYLGLLYKDVPVR